MVLLRHIAALLVALIAGCAFQFLERGPYVESFAAAGRSSIAIDGVDGDVEVQGSATASDVLMRGTRRALGATRERAKENLEHARLDPRDAGAQLVLDLDPPLELVGLLDLELVGPSVFPRDLGLAVEVAEGDLTVADLRGEITLETGDGDVSVQGAGPGAVSVVTDDGNASVEALGPVLIDAAGKVSLAVPDVEESPVDVVTAGGNVTVEIVPQALEITVDAEGGELTVDPALGLEPVGAGSGSEYLMTDSEDFDGPWKLVKISSHGGNVDILALPAE